MNALTFAPTRESKELSHKHNYSEWVVNRFLHYIPNVYEFLEKMDRPNQKYIRVNSLKTSRDELKSRLSERGFMLEDTIIDDVFAVTKSPHPLGATPEYLLGYYYIQDLSSCLAVTAMNPAHEQINLDMCAAPGGKTTYIAQRMSNTGLLVAIESNKKRINSIIFNLNRCGVINTCVYNFDALHSNKLELKYDRILLDAPCTCEGVIPKDVSRKKSHVPEDIAYCSNRQQKLIDAAMNVIKPGGTLVYSTCSFAPEENEMVVDYVLQKYDVDIIPIEYGSEGIEKFGDAIFNPEVKNARRFYPHIHNTLGFFIAEIKVK